MDNLYQKMLVIDRVNSRNRGPDAQKEHYRVFNQMLDLAKKQDTTVKKLKRKLFWQDIFIVSVLVVCVLSYFA